MEKSRQAIRFLGLSFFIGLSIFGGVAGGLWLDRKLNTQPVFILVGLAVGLVVAFWGVYRIVAPLLIKNNNDDDKNTQRRG